MPGETVVRIRSETSSANISNLNSKNSQNVSKAALVDKRFNGTSPPRTWPFLQIGFLEHPLFNAQMIKPREKSSVGKFPGLLGSYRSYCTARLDRQTFHHISSTVPGVV